MRRRVSILRKDVSHLAGRIVGRKGASEAEPRSSAEEEGSRPPSSTGSNPWRENGSGAGPSSSQPPTARTKQKRRLSYDSATGVMNLSDDDEWVDAPDEADSDEDVVDTSGGTNTPGSMDSGERERPDISGRRVPKRRSTYWHHPDRKRVSAAFGSSATS